MSNLIHRFKINDLGCTEKEFASMPFGRQIEFSRKLEAFKTEPDVMHTWLSQKRTTSAKAIAEFKKMMRVKEYYCSFHDDENYRDDTFQFYYRQNNHSI